LQICLKKGVGLPEEKSDPTASGRHSEDVESISGKIDVQTLRGQPSAVTNEHRLAHQIPELERGALHLIQGDPDIALATVRRIIDDNNKFPSCGFIPAIRKIVIP
jgi:hypothetical protein